MRDVYPALLELRYFDGNVPVMNKIYYFVKKEGDALLNSQPILNDDGFFGSMSGTICDGTSKETCTGIGKSENEEFLSDDKLR